MDNVEYNVATNIDNTLNIPKKYYADLHCHPILTPFHKKHVSWDNELKSPNLWQKKMVDNPQDRDKRIEDKTTLAPYTKSDFPKLAKGRVRVIFASLTPIEYGFMANPLLTNVVKAYPMTKIKEMISSEHDYFKYLEKEYSFLKDHQSDKSDKIDGKTFKYQLVKNYSELKNLINIDDEYKLKPCATDECKIAVVLTVEGGHALGCGQKNTIFYEITDYLLKKYPEFSKEKFKKVPKKAKEIFDYLEDCGYKLTEKRKQKILKRAKKNCSKDFSECDKNLLENLKDNIKKLKKWDYCPFIITFAHHFWNQLCGHSITVPSVALGVNEEFTKFGKDVIRILLDNTKNKVLGMNEEFTKLGKDVVRILLDNTNDKRIRIIDITKALRKNQVLGMNEGFTKLGKDIIKILLDNTNGKRILIDTRHMSIKARAWYYTYLGFMTKEEYKECSGDEYKNEIRFDRLPIISSHSAVNGIETMKKSIEENKSHDEAIKKYDKSTTFNNWDVNLSDQEIIIIYKSEGLIGLGFDQRVSGGKGGGKNRINRIANNILYIAEVASKADFSECWNCITIGTDYDGNINPINDFRTAEKFTGLEKSLKSELESRNEYHRLLNDNSSEEVVDRIMYRNAMEFLKKNFK
ncbi:MAG: hypothetical protein B6244_06205 [Candidatus Cloacimonetes bacterium 4572_55]|nr:MAG: hypothetical protein B6244_06205 [Candidatus Cloacimonetes bacterium 4572_55]